MKVEYSEQFKNLIKVWDKAVIQKEKHAQYTLASFYLKIQTETADKKAFDLYKKSAKQGYTEAMYALGICYELGNGVRKNYYQAVHWYICTDENITDDLMNNPDPIGDAAQAAIRRYFEDEEFAEFVDETLDNEKMKQTTLLQLIKKLRGLGTPRHKTDWDIGTFTATEQNRISYRRFIGIENLRKAAVRQVCCIWQNTIEIESSIKKRQNGTVNMLKQESNGGTNALAGKPKNS